MTYRSLSSEEHIEKAIESDQRIVVDLQEDKWFGGTNLIDAEVISESKVKFTDDSEEIQTDEPDLVQIDKTKAGTDTDDAFSRDTTNESSSKKDAIKPLNKPASETDNDKPVVKALEELDQSYNEISIIITNLGLNESIVKAASRLGKNFTMSFTPYGQVTTKYSIQLSEEDFSVLVELPMESTKAREDAGKFALSPSKSDSENNQAFAAIDSIAPTAIGFITPPDEDFSGGDGTNLDKLLSLLASKNSTIVYRGSSPKNAREFASINGADLIIPDMVIDNQPTSADIGAQLRALEIIAKEKGSAIGIVRPYPVSFTVLDEWQDTLKKKKIKLVKVVQR